MSARLVRSLARAEAAAAAAAAGPEVELPGVCLCWRGRNRVDAEVLADGEYIAVDVTLLCMAPLFQQVEECERVTVDESDLGWVYGPGSVRIGRVVAIDGDLVTQELDADWRLHVPQELPPLCDVVAPVQVAAAAEEAPV